MRYTIINGYKCEPMSGGYWSVSKGGELIAAWIGKAEVMRLVA